MQLVERVVRAQRTAAAAHIPCSRVHPPQHALFVCPSSAQQFARESTCIVLTVVLSIMFAGLVFFFLYTIFTTGGRIMFYESNLEYRQYIWCAPPANASKAFYFFACALAYRLLSALGRVCVT